MKNSQSSIIHTVIRLQIGRSGVQIPVGERDPSSTECPALAILTTQPPVQWVLMFFHRGKETGA